MPTRKQQEAREKLLSGLRFIEANAQFIKAGDAADETWDSEDKFTAVEVPGNGLFQWDFTTVHEEFMTDGPLKKCGTMGCAMGLAKELGLVELSDMQADLTALSEVLGISYKNADRAFYGSGGVYEEVENIRDTVGPGDVADFLETIFAEGVEI